MDEAKANPDKAREDVKQTNIEYDRMLSRADAFQTANTEIKHMIMAALIERIDIGVCYEMNIKFKISAG